jgi:hypothetical protein
VRACLQLGLPRRVYELRGIARRGNRTTPPGNLLARPSIPLAEFGLSVQVSFKQIRYLPQRSGRTAP